MAAAARSGVARHDTKAQEAGDNAGMPAVAAGMLGSAGAPVAAATAGMLGAAGVETLDSVICTGTLVGAGTLDSATAGMPNSVTAGSTVAAAADIPEHSRPPSDLGASHVIAAGCRVFAGAAALSIVTSDAAAHVSPASLWIFSWLEVL